LDLDETGFFSHDGYRLLARELLFNKSARLCKVGKGKGKKTISEHNPRQNTKAETFAEEVSAIFNILIISHGPIAQGYLDALAVITGEMPVGMEACSIDEGESRIDLANRIHESMERLRCPDGVLVFADMFGGTPCNVAVEELLNGNSKIYLLAGFNLSMLLTAAGNRERDLIRIAQEAREAAHLGIVDVNSRVAEAAQTADNE